MRAVRDYVVNHWRGQLSLPVSIFVSGIGSYALVWAFIALAVNLKIPSLIFLIAVLYIVLFIWLLFGVMRSGRRLAQTSKSRSMRVLGRVFDVIPPLIVLYFLGHDYALMFHLI